VRSLDHWTTREVPPFGFASNPYVREYWRGQVQNHPATIQARDEGGNELGF